MSLSSFFFFGKPKVVLNYRKVVGILKAMFILVNKVDKFMQSCLLFFSMF